MRALVCLICVLLAAGGAGAAERVALVVGNARYAHVGDLANPPNDAAEIAAALREAGFEVTEIADAGFDRLRRALARFGDAAGRADTAVIYFAGHGMEIDRRNYLLPVDAELSDPDDVAFHAVPLSLMRRAAGGAARLSLVIVDACRNNPFLERMRAEGRSLARGLARVREGGDDDLVAFAAREGTIAEDGEGANSPYAAALARALREPGLEIGKLFRRVRDDVREATRGRQEPALYGSLSEEDFYFVPPEEEREPARDARGLELAPAGTLGASSVPVVEVSFWNSIAGSDDPRDFEDYLERFPGGTFAGIARRRLDELRAGARASGPSEEAEALARAEPAESAAPAARPEPPEPPAFEPTRSQVRDAQARLNILGHDAGPADGLPGRRTEAAVARFQRARGEQADGRLSEGVLAALAAAVPAAELAAWRRAEAERREASRAARRETEPAAGEGAGPAGADEAPETALARPPAATEPARLTVELSLRFRSNNAWRGCLDPIRAQSASLVVSEGAEAARLFFDDARVAFEIRAERRADGLAAVMVPEPDGQSARAPREIALPEAGATRRETHYLGFGSTARPACGSLIAHLTTRRE
jgi:hypothetical protein